jgi:hypothetical protein
MAKIQPIYIYASGTAGLAPTSGTLVNDGSLGSELALNYADGKLYYQPATGSPAVLANATFAQNTNLSITYVMDGGGVVLTTGIKGDLYIPFKCTITSYTLLADQTGSVVVDIWKDVYANYPPVVADNITGSSTFTGSISNGSGGAGTILTVSGSPSSGTIVIGQTLTGAGISGTCTIVSGTGPYVVSSSQNVSGITITGTGAGAPTISSSNKAQSSTLTGWVTTINAGDTLRFNVNSVTTITRATLSLTVVRS